MRLADEITLSLRTFRNRPKRTFLTIFGVSIGISAVLFLVSLGYGLQGAIIGQITTADSLLTLDVSTGSTDVLPIDQPTVEAIAKLPNVSEVVRLRTMAGQISSSSITTDISLRGIDSGLLRLSGLQQPNREPYTLENPNDVLLSSAAVKLLGLPDDQILGQSLSVTIYTERLDDEGNSQVDSVVGVTPFIISGVIEDDSTSYAYLQLAAMNEIVPITHFDALKVKASSQAVAPQVRDQIIARGFIVSAISDVIDQAVRIFRIVQIALGGFGLVALFVSAIGMFNTMTIALLERTNEIGIMRSVGVTPRDIGRLFVVESMLMGFLGGTMGILLGYLTGELANFGFNILAKQLGGQTVDLFTRPWWFIGVIVAFSTLIGFITGFFPARRAAKMDPLEALRYK